VVNLKHAAIQALDFEKRDYVIQISGARDNFWYIKKDKKEHLLI
jgi:hypothetical protein